MRGKRKRKDVAEFSIHFMDNIFNLHDELTEKTYRHGSYHFFKINDPKPRHIHKAPVRDRLMHHAIHRILYPYFDRKFIHDSYSCRVDKGTYRAMDRFNLFAGKVSRNHTRTAWVLKCDIKKFFASISHIALKSILQRYMGNNQVFWLLDQVIDSFHTSGKTGIGLPLGNLTSQLFINIYMNELDQFVKRELEVRYYIRYADDFVMLHENRDFLRSLIPIVAEFLKKKLKLFLHPDKVLIKTFASGVDFLGWVHFSHHRILRTTTKRRVLKKLQKNQSRATIDSYDGLLSHGNTYKIVKRIQRMFLTIFALAKK